MTAKTITRTEDGVQIAYPQTARLIDESQIQEVANELMEIINSIDQDRLLVNFSTVGFMGSAMIGKLIMLDKKCKSLHLDMRLCCLNDNIMEVFRLMKLDTVFKIYDDESTAVKQFKEHKKKWYV